MTTRILVVEDDPSIRMGLEDTLAAKGYEVDVVGRGGDGAECPGRHGVGRRGAAANPGCLGRRSQAAVLRDDDGAGSITEQDAGVAIGVVEEAAEQLDRDDQDVAVHAGADVGGGSRQREHEP